MAKVRTGVTWKIFKMILLCLLLCPIYSVAEEVSADVMIPPDCETKCGCDGMYIYDADNERCLINFKKVMRRVFVTYEKNNVDALPEDGMARSIYVEGEKIFKGILISVMLFITCASVCVISACIYCCRINFTDRTLKHNVKALAKKMKKEYNSKNMVAKRAPLPAMSESCNVVVEEAGVFVA